MYKQAKAASIIYSAFSDESGCFSKRYQSIGVVSGKNEHLASLREELARCLGGHKTKEVHFEEVRSHKPKVSAANDYVDTSVKYIAQGKVKIDVLCWDTQDSRHGVLRRDNVANLERMYFKILRNISEKWRQDKWHFYPDKGSKLNWAEITSFLNKTRLNRKPQFLTLFHQEVNRIKFLEVIPRDSIDEPLIQLADLFAGMTCFSILRSYEYSEWQRSECQVLQSSLFSHIPSGDHSRTSQNRFALLAKVYLLGKKYGLQISLPKDGYLRSFKKEAPLNFWHYHPKGSFDKAPVRTQVFS